MLSLSLTGRLPLGPHVAVPLLGSMKEIVGHGGAAFDAFTGAVLQHVADDEQDTLHLFALRHVLALHGFVD